MRALRLISLGLLAVSGLALPAHALTPPWQLCENPNGSFADDITIYDENDEWLPNMTTFTMRPTDMDADDVTEVIVHCETRQAVFYVLDAQDHGGYDLLRSSMQGSDAVTLRQLARRLKRKGVDAKFATLAKAHCACKPQTHKASF